MWVLVRFLRQTIIFFAVERHMSPQKWFISIYPASSSKFEIYLRCGAKFPTDDEKFSEAINQSNLSC
jgi:hypothetical protein